MLVHLLINILNMMNWNLQNPWSMQVTKTKSSVSLISVTSSQLQEVMQLVAEAALHSQNKQPGL